MADPRLYRIAVLASLLVYGMAGLDFEITVTRAALLLLTVRRSATGSKAGLRTSAAR